MSTPTGDSIDGYTPKEPEYWTLMAKIIGNPVPDEQDADDSEFVSTDGIVIGEVDPQATKTSSREEL
jgi:hypothetical protein